MSATALLRHAAAAQEADSEAYRRTPYPIAVHATTHPDRLAAIATAAGMAPPDPRTARVLEIGAGNALNLLAMAAAMPDARFVATDIVADAIEQGRDWARRAGLDNVELIVADLMDPDALAGEFDYIIAHGLFAWVPAPVGEALLALIGRHLSADGVAFVSYNALPGGYVRIGLREAMLHAVGDAVDPAERMRRGVAALEQVAEAAGDDTPVQAAFRYYAKVTAQRSENVLLHDELGGHFRPRYVGEAIAEAAAHGLAFLGDARKLQLRDGFLPDDAALPDDPDAAIVARAIEQDFRDVQAFRSSLFVRREARPARRLDAAALERLWVSSPAHVEGERRVGLAGQNFDIVDPALMAALERIIAAWPARLLVAGLALDAARRSALFDLFDVGIVTLHAMPAPFSLEPGARPVTSPLVRVMLEDGLPWAATLNHAALDLKEGARDVLLALDGSGDEARLARAAAAAGLDTPDALTGGIAALAQLAVFA